MLRFVILLTLLTTACGKDNHIPTSILKDKDIPDTVLKPCFVIPASDSAECSPWRLKDLTFGDETETETIPLADLPLPRVVLSVADFTALKHFLFPFLKVVYKNLYNWKVTPQQFNAALDTLEKKI